MKRPGLPLAMAAGAAAALGALASASPAPVSILSDAPTLRAVSNDRGPEVVRARAVAVDADAVRALLGAATRAAADEPARIDLPFFPDAAAIMTATSAAPPAPGAPEGSGVLVGEIDGVPGSHAFISVAGGVVIGDVFMPGKGSFQIRPITGPDGEPVAHEVREVDEAQLAPCGVTAEHVFNDPAARAPEPAPEAEADGAEPRAVDPYTIDVLVVYTPAARDRAGSATAMNAAMASWAAQTNAAYTSSFVNQQIRLVGVELTNYTEQSSPSADLTALRSTSDGRMDEVHARRNALGADVVHLVCRPNSSTICGIAYVQTSPGPGFAGAAFGLTSYSCGGLTFAHELGHNMGCAHDRQNASSGAYCYSFGYRTPNNQYRTIMAYAPGSRIARFSSPLVTWNGYTMGVSGDGCPSNSADNARTLNNTAPIVAAFRSATTPPPPPPPQVPGPFSLTSPANGAVVANTRPTLAWSTSSGAQTYTVTLARNAAMTDVLLQQQVGGATSFTLPSGALDYGATCHWSVAATNAAGTTHATPASYSFRVRARADVNADGYVNADDLSALLGAWGPCGACASDFNGDGVVDAADLATLLGVWGAAS